MPSPGSPSGFYVAHHVLDAGVVLQAVHRQVLAVAGVLEAAVRHLRHEWDVRVDPDAPEVQPSADPHGAAMIFRKHAGGEAVLHAVGPADGFVLVGEMLDGDDGAEDLVLGGFVFLFEARDHGGGVEIAPVPQAFSADRYLGVVWQSLHHAGDVRELVGVVQGAVIRVLVVGIARPGVPRLLGDGVHEVVVDARGREDPRGGGAVLAGVEVAGTRDGLGGRFEVGVVEDDYGRLTSELEVHALEVVGGRFGDLHTRSHGARYGHHLGRRVLDQRPARVPVAAHHVEDAFGQELGGDLRHHHRRDRSGVRGLYHDGVAGRYGRGELPDRHHHRVVPGGYLAYDAYGLAPDERRVTF